jgi:hypothetical protein
MFGSRYLLFHELSSAAFNGESAKSDSYYILLKISLAYSAIEAVEKLLGQEQLSLKDSDLAAVIQSLGTKTFEAHLNQAISSPSLKQSLTAFFEDGAPSELRPIVTAIRHGFFHPKLSATGLGLRSNLALREALLGLIGVIDGQLEESFAKWSSEHLSTCNLVDSY